MRRALLLIALLVGVGAFASVPVSAGTPDDPVAETIEELRSESPLDSNIAVVTGDVVIGLDVKADYVAVGRGSVSVKGEVAETVFVGDGLVVVSGTVLGDVMVVSGNVRVDPGGVIKGDVYASAIVTSGDGTIEGEARALSLSNASDAASNFATQIMDAASFFLWLATTASYLVLGLLVVWLFPRGLSVTSEVGRKSVGKSIGWGVILTIVLPIIVVIFLVLAVTTPFAMGLFFAMFLLNAVGLTVTQTAVGQGLVGLIDKTRAGNLLIPFLVGWVLFSLVALLPLAGLVVLGLGSIYGVGALAVAVWRARQASKELGSTTEPEIAAEQPTPA